MDAMIFLRLLSWPYARKHPLRTTLTLAGIVLGVAVFAAAHAANESVLYGFQETVNQIAGKTQLQISRGESGFDEDVLEEVQSEPGVAAAAPVIEAIVNTGIRGQGSLLVLGVDMTGDRSLRQYDVQGDEDAIDDPLIFLAQPDSLMVSRSFAARNGLSVNSRLSMATMDGQRQFTIRGIMRSGGLAGAFGGNIAVMDIYAAQKVFGRGRKFDRIDVMVRETVSVEEARQALRKRLGQGFQIASPATRGQYFESISHAFAASINFFSVFALLIAMFIIYNTFATSVAQRRPEIGILRTLGATRSQISVFFLAEGAVAGLAGSAVGLLVGALLARGMRNYILVVLGEAFGVDVIAQKLGADFKLMFSAIALGVGTSVLAAWLPARSAARVDPAVALHKGGYQVLPPHESHRRFAGGCVLAAFSVACLLTGGAPAVFYGAYALLVLATLLVTPGLVAALTRVLRPLLGILRPIEGLMAADSLTLSVRRTSAAVIALMLAVALAIGFGGVALASHQSIVDWLNASFNADLLVSSSETLSARSFWFPDSMVAELKKMPAVAEVQAVRTVHIIFHQTPVLLAATDLESVGKWSSPRRIAGRPREMYRQAARGEGVIISDNLALQQGLSVGQIIEIPAPRETLYLPIVGVVTDYSDQQGTIFVDRSVFIPHWRDNWVNIFRVYLHHGISDTAAKRDILERFGSQRRLFVFTSEEVRRYILRVTDQWLALTYIQLAVATLVAVLGIFNNLTVSVTDRRRELAVLQAVGGERRQVRQTLWIEGTIIGIFGLVLGLALGALNLEYNLEMVRQNFAGLRLDYRYPFEIVKLLVPVILAASLLAAMGPAEFAVRVPLVEGLEYE